MSTRGWKEFRRRRTFPVTRSLITNGVPFCVLKRQFFGKFDPLMETFLECETVSRATTWTLVRGKFGEIDRRKVVRLTRHKKQRVCMRPIFCALSETHRVISLETCKPYSLFRRQAHLPTFIQIHPTFPDLLAKTTFQIVTISYNITYRSDIRNLRHISSQ